ncbi:MAG: SsrA-binding protein SmpB [Pirellulales bacterium]|nr:SsrA-binding protein SmpB [Pirellulales bacterium]
MAAKKLPQSGKSPTKGAPAPGKAAPPGKGNAGKGDAGKASTKDTGGKSGGAKSTGKAERQLSEEKQKDNERTITENRKARFEYFVLDTLECGIVLVGTEVKSLRAGHVTIEDGFARIKGGEVWLVNVEIKEYRQGNHWNHEPKRPRKLLLHKRELQKFAAKSDQKGFTLVPLKMYFKGGRAKVLLGVCRGKQKHDKRDSLKKADAQRDMQRALRRGK